MPILEMNLVYLTVCCYPYIATINQVTMNSIHAIAFDNGHHVVVFLSCVSTTGSICDSSQWLEVLAEMVMAVLVGTVAYVGQVASFESAVVEIEAGFSCMGLLVVAQQVVVEVVEMVEVVELVEVVEQVEVEEQAEVED